MLDDAMIDDAMLDYPIARSLAGPLHYRWIAPDYGGTYTHTTTPRPNIEKAPDRLDLPAIGTWQCRTCVGVYLKISPTSCFVAHINAAHLRPTWDTTARAKDACANRIVTEEEGAYVQAEVIRRLEEESVRSNWPPKHKISRAWLVCPMLTYEGQALSGMYIAQGIRDFLDQQCLLVDTTNEGFVVEFARFGYPSDYLETFPFNRVGEQELPLPDDGIHYVGHRFHGNELPRWFIDIGGPWRARDNSGVAAARRRFSRVYENVEADDSWEIRGPGQGQLGRVRSASLPECVEDTSMLKRLRRRWSV